jgi:transforming growth factor-beta-induced protein
MKSKMNRVIGSLLVIVMVLILAVPVVAADVQEGTIVDIAVADGRFTTLVAAVTYAGLADALSGGEWTVFAPTDAAFAKLDLNADNISSAFTKEELTDILLYHVMTSREDSAALLGMLGDITMANGQLAGLKEFDGNLYVNDDSKVIIPNIFADNGVIHVVDNVILGPWPREAPVAEETPVAEEAPVAEETPVAEEVAVGGGAEEMPEEMAAEEAAPSGNSIVDIAVNDGRFDTLVAAVTYAGLADALSGGEWTAFAPTDNAFAKLDLNADNISSAFTKEELTDILLYHVMTSREDSAALLGMLGDITMANGQLAGLKEFDGNLYVNDDSKVIIADIFADNGVIHVVDTVILGPWPK